MPAFTTSNFRSILAFLIVLGALHLPGCGTPPPPARSARNDIKAAEDSMASGKLLFQRGQYELARTEYERAFEEIAKGEGYAEGTELSQLRNMKEEARSRKIQCDTLALEHPSRTKPVPPPAVVAPTDKAPVVIEASKKDIEAAKLAEQQRKSLEVADAPLPGKTSKKVEPEDSPEKALNKVAKDLKDAADAPAKTANKDKAGIFPDITESSPPLQVVKLLHKGKFVVAYFQLNNKTDNGKRISVSTFFKNRDNQIVLEPRTTAAFPYERFSTTVADLLGDQSVHNLTAQSDEINAHDYLQLVSVGEAPNDEVAKQIVKAYISVVFSDNSTAEGTGPEGGAANAVPALKLK